jgi:hypothetical protein
MDALSSRYLAISKFLDFYLYNLYSLLKGSIQVNSEKEKIARNLGSEVIFTKNTKFLFGDNKDKPIPAEIQGIAHSNLYDKKESPNPCILFKSNYLKLILDSIKINYLRFILKIFKIEKYNNKASDNKNKLVYYNLLGTEYYKKSPKNVSYDCSTPHIYESILNKHTIKRV